MDRDRPDHNNLKVFELHEGRKNKSVYKSEFQAMSIKKEAIECIKGKDHLLNKENYSNEGSISEYKRRYDSVIGLTKQESLPALSRKPKNKQ